MQDISCQNCGKSMKKKLFGIDIVAVPQSQVDFINKYLGENKESYCSDCATPLLIEIVNNLEEKSLEHKNRIKKNIDVIPIMTSQAPNKWDYDVIGMVTSQITAGTGFTTELSRSFNDFFGQGSNTTNMKVANTTTLCQQDIRMQCINRGGNAVIAADIDFNEIGAGSTNMLMVCMAGTAIRIKNIEIFSQEVIQKISEINESIKIMNTIKDDMIAYEQAQ